MQELFVKYFSELFSCLQPIMSPTIRELLQSLISIEDNEALTRVPTTEEIRDVAFQIGELKAPGPDGMSASFFHKCWSIIEQDVVSFIQSLFFGDEMLPEVNFTNIVVIPKVKCPETVAHFRPISLRNDDS
uniref:Uncharacterized protein n=1 Tax=Nelumbo nucifera TaxID=4432 RepID=A0A822Y3H6_NELNU|nr:TPA_asm: hypothetical protein HUJ06_027254 [Nelumbo nucifera]